MPRSQNSHVAHARFLHLYPEAMVLDAGLAPTPRSIVIPDVITHKKLAEVRKLLGHIPSAGSTRAICASDTCGRKIM
jgi:hypothetical protein